MNSSRIIAIGVFAIFISLFSSCNKEKDDPIIPNEEELITTVIYTLVDTLTNDSLVFTYRDIDGDGGNPPIIEVDSIKANSYYLGFITLLNEAVNPSIDIGIEVENEAEEHQFFFIIQSSLGIEIEYADLDANANPLGMKTSFKSWDESAGEFTIILKHEPNKFAPGVSDGQIGNAGGETDVEVSFFVSILE